MRRVLWIAGLCASMLCGQPAQKPLDSAWDLMKKGLQDNNPERRKQTAAALSGAGLDPQVLQLLDDAMAKDKDPEVRQAAAASLGELKARAAIPKLKTAMDSDPAVSFAAARALWLMGDKSGKDIIEEVASSTQKKSTTMMGQAKMDASRKLHDPNGLERMGAEQVATALLGPFSIGLTLANELRKDAGAQGRLLAITMLTQQCDADSQSALEAAFQTDKNEIVRAGAAKALGICGDRNLMQQLSDAVISEKFPVQLASAATLIRFSSGSLQKK